MAGIGAVAAKKVINLLTAKASPASSIGEVSNELGLSLPEVSAYQVLSQNVASDLLEKSTTTKYPTVQVYCGKLTNLLTEKFRTFSGEAQMVAEVRVSGEHIEGMDVALQGYADAICELLNRSRGDWGDGVFYCGGYEINYGPVRSGGKNFLQAAKIMFTLRISN